MMLIERKLAKILGYQTAALDDAVENLKMASAHREHAAERLKADDLSGAKRVLMIEALLVAEAHLNIGLYHSVYGRPEKAGQHLARARSAFLEQHNLDIAAQITRYMETLGIAPSKAI